MKAMALFYSGVQESVIVRKGEEIPKEFLPQHMIKIVCIFEEATEADSFQDQAKQNPFFRDCCVLKSWPVGVEFNSSGGTKGKALEFIKQHLGHIHTTIGVGDYENDIPLLTHADIGAAPENAIDSVKEIAKIRLKSAEQCAIKDLIEQLEKRIEK